MRVIEVEAYSSDWGRAFAAEAEALQSVFGSSLQAVEHIGSTSVVGLAAKPIIDILLVVDRLAVANALTPGLASLGYSANGENGIPGRRYFVKGADDRRSHHLHVFERGSDQIERHLLFRDYLRAHPDAAACYADLKIALAREHREDPSSYQAGKEAFISEMRERARIWRASGPADS